jgi:murein DD-endopeptidase MepM/ murein hydrolase activator NlpD
VKNIFIVISALFIIIFMVIKNNLDITENKHDSVPVQQHCLEISGTVKKGETLFDIFKRYKLDIADLLKLKEASADIHRLKALSPGQTYKIYLDDNKGVNSFIYCIDDDNILHVTRNGSKFCAEKMRIEYETRIQEIGGLVKNNLIASIGEGRENLMLALQISDIFSWDIDFNTDLRDRDTFKFIVEGYYLNGEFKKYGNVLAAEFVNNGETYHVYRFQNNGETDYYDDAGKSLKRAFLKAPLSFRRISSAFSNKRFHPILKISRPHHGLDYSAAAGTPVSAVGEGTVVFSGYKGSYGKLVAIRHPNNWKTYYGHLSKIHKGVKRGRKVQQGQVIGYIGSTGLATGPHLHYEVRVHNKPVNPLALKLPRGRAVTSKLMAEFSNLKDQMDTRLASIEHQYFVQAKSTKDKEKKSKL